MIARIRDYLYRLWPMLAIRRIRRSLARRGVPPGGFTKQSVEHGATDFARTLASAAATVEEVAATARAVGDALQSIVEIQAAVADPDQLRTLLDLARSGDKSQFVELARSKADISFALGSGQIMCSLHWRASRLTRSRWDLTMPLTSGVLQPVASETQSQPQLEGGRR